MVYTSLQNTAKDSLFLLVKQFVISHVQNEQGTGYEYLKSIELKYEARHLKEHPEISKFTIFEGYCFNAKAWYAFKNRWN